MTFAFATSAGLFDASILTPTLPTGAVKTAESGFGGRIAFNIPVWLTHCQFCLVARRE